MDNVKLSGIGSSFIKNMLKTDWLHNRRKRFLMLCFFDLRKKITKTSKNSLKFVIYFQIYEKQLVFISKTKK